MKEFYVGNNRLLVVNPKGAMRVLYTPFRVYDPTSKRWEYVQEVTRWGDDGLMYLIKGKLYPHSGFEIRIKF